MSYLHAADIGRDQPVPRIQIFRTQVQIDEHLTRGNPGHWRVLGKSFPPKEAETIHPILSDLDAREHFFVDYPTGRTILVEVDAI